MPTIYSNRVSWACSIVLKSRIEQVFPLFTPEEEKKWANGWDYEPIYPLPLQVKENCIFRTESHDHKNV
jgi:hypothetical protein